MQITTDTSQIKDLLTSAQKILIATRRNPSIDGVGSMLAFGSALKNQNKAVTYLCEDFLKEKFTFLAGSEQIQSKLPPKSLIVSIDLKGNPIEKINYETKDGRLDLIITPKQGEISAESIEFFETNLNFDLVTILDTKEISLLGNVAQVHAQGLKKVPILNIDSTQENAQFGKINLIDETASSVAEALFSLLQDLNLPVGADSATALLAGTVEKTNGFCKNVSAQTFKVASELTQLGANLELINQNVFRETAKPQNLVKPLGQGSSNEQPFIR